MKQASRETVEALLKGYPEFMDVNDVADALNCSTKTVYRLIVDEKLEVVRVGRKTLITRIGVIDYLTRPIDVNSW